MKGQVSRSSVIVHAHDPFMNPSAQDETRIEILVRTGRVELPFPCGSQILSLVRLPIPPRSLADVLCSNYNIQPDYSPFSVPQTDTSNPISRNIAAFAANARFAPAASGA